MKALVIAFLLLNVAGGISAQEAHSTQDAPFHFRWSRRDARELDYKQTIQTSAALTPGEKRLLLEAVLHKLREQRERSEQQFEDISDRQLRTLAANTRIELIDLNGDGARDVIAQANGLGPCGGTGNCIVWIFELRPEGIQILLDSMKDRADAFEVVTVRPWSTNGYKDIVLGSHISATERLLVSFRYSRGAYRQSACYYSTWTGAGGKRLTNPDISLYACDNSSGQGK